VRFLLGLACEVLLVMINYEKPFNTKRDATLTFTQTNALLT